MFDQFDQDANIEEQRQIAARMSACYAGKHSGSRCDCPADGLRLAELVIQLDGWLCSSGTLPTTWDR